MIEEKVTAREQVAVFVYDLMTGKTCLIKVDCNSIGQLLRRIQKQLGIQQSQSGILTLEGKPFAMN